MVYSGRPSRACGRCRARRIKCDLGRPQCRKCQTAKTVCPGYRNEQDLLFRDQTNDVVCKNSEKTTARTVTTKHRGTTQSALKIKCIALVQDPTTISGKFIGDEGTLAVAVTFLLRCYFRGSSFEWVSKIYGTTSCSPVLTDVVRATALAAYSHESHRIRLLMQARTMYNDALTRVREAIERGESTTDPIWGSVLLMSRFETLLNDGSECSITDNWLNHVSGAFAIMQARKRQQEESGRDAAPESPVTRALMEQTIHNYNLYCFRHRMQPPTSLILATKELYQHVGDLDTDNNTSSSNSNQTLKGLRLAFHQISAEFSDFRRAQLDCRTTTRLRLIRWAQDIDAKVVNFQHRLAAVSRYQRVPVSNLKKKGEYGLDFRPCFDFYHVYRNHHEARLWNGIRMIRITMHETINWCAASLSVQSELGRSLDSTLLQDDGHDSDNDSYHEELQSLMVTSIRMVQEIVNDICASAPQFLRPGAPECTHAAACFLMWPLFIAGRLAMGEHRVFVEEALCWIAAELNIKSARIAVEYLPIEEYKDGCMHACYMF